MNYRSTEILASESIATAATKVVDLNLQAPISRLSLIIKVTNATNSPVGHPAEVIKKIEILDGANVIFSMNGSSAAALNFYAGNPQPPQMLDYILPEYFMFPFNINFGRYLYDEELALDPSKYHNLQLRITHDKALGGGTPTAGNLAVRADVFDEKAVSPVGVLVSKQHYSFTQVADTVYYIDLPTDLAMRLMMHIVSNTTEGPEYNITNIKLSEDNDKRILLEGDTEFLLPVQPPISKQWIDNVYGMLTTTARSFYVAPTWERQGATTQIEDSNSTIFNTGSAGMKLSILGEIACNFSGVFPGFNPFGSFPYQFGKQNDINDWWGAVGQMSKRLKLTCAAGPDTSEPCDIIVQQYQPY